MSIDAQGSLFGEGRMTPPPRRSSTNTEAIRSRLNRLLETLQAASKMPLSERDVQMWKQVVPNMTKWLPDTEAEAMRTALAHEIERLERSSFR